MKKQFVLRTTKPKSSRYGSIQKTVTALFCALLVWTGGMESLLAQTESISVDDLSAFRDPPESWRMVGNVFVPLDGSRGFEAESGSGVIVNLPSESTPGLDVFTRFEHGDIDLELEYMMAEGSNSGIYLQGRYELQLLDSWGKTEVTFADNGGIYEGWDESGSEGKKHLAGTPPVQNASRAPGLWQKLKISFQAPRFDGQGEKTDNARLLRAELNGVLIQDDVELQGPTGGAIKGKESPKGPLRIQGDHGPVAFRNIRIKAYPGSRPPLDGKGKGKLILVDPERTPLVRSFMDVPGGPRITHAISAFSPKQVHYTYDLGHGSLVQVWRGHFLDITQVWGGRGNGVPHPLGTVQYLLQKPALTVAELVSTDEEWPTDSTIGDYRSHGYRVDDQSQPTFAYEAYGSAFEDAVQALDEGKGFRRTLSVENGSENLFVRLALGDSIKKLRNGTYLVGDHAYYIRMDEAGGAEPIVRQVGEQAELLVPLRGKITYSLLF